MHHSLSLRAPDDFLRIILVSEHCVGEIVGGRCARTLRSRHAAKCDGTSITSTSSSVIAANTPCECCFVEHIVPSERFMGAAAVCALIPIAGAAPHVRTSGLKWDLDGRELAFGRLISTSNAFAGGGDRRVTIESTHPLLFQSSLAAHASIE